MKKTRILLIINCIQAVVLVAAIVVSIIIIPKIMIFKKKRDVKTSTPSIPVTQITGTDNDKYNGYADVTEYGAVPNDNKDDTEAFLKAIKTGASIYVPLGVFEIKDTLLLNGQSLKGCGINRSKIVATGDKTLISASGSVVIEDITLGFSENNVKENEKEGDKVVFLDNGLTDISTIKSVEIDNVGTGIYCPESDKINSSLTIESVIFNNFSYRAIDIKNAYSTMIRSTFIKHSKGNINAAASLGGTFTLESLTFDETESDYIIEFLNSKSAVVKSLLFNQTNAKSGSIIHSISSMMSIQSVTLLKSDASSLIKIDDQKDLSESVGNIISFCTDKNIKIDEQNRIICQSISN